MDVYDFCTLCTEDSTTVAIYDMNENVEEEVFKGEMRDAISSEWAGYEVESFDLWEGLLTLNIDTTEEQEE